MARLTYQSFQLLLNLEWLLLATAIFMEVLLPFQASWTLLFRVLTIALFGLLGLRLPTGALFSKVLYTALEFGLIAIAAFQEGLSNRSVFLLCLVLVMRSCLLFNRFGQVVVLSLSLLTYTSLLFIKPVLPAKVAAVAYDWRISNVLLFSLTLVFALLLINALLAERQSREQLETAHQQLRHYALRIEDQATLQERNRIAREIHDGLGHTLAAQTIQINNSILFWQSNPDQALTAVKQAKKLGAEALLEVRKSVSVLRSNPLQGLPLEKALQKLLNDFQQTTGLEVIDQLHLSAPLPSEMSTTLYRIVQESLTNIAKHAQAHCVRVELQARSNLIILSIDDDGIGFNPTQNTTGFGLQGMRERALALGGQFTLQSQTENGCHISVSLPLTPQIL
ncbi:integral membrane sensor signal transduction histidine kinase [Leptolyngbya sp. NIES-3755]|nr:integral membrane sensor signal transduction histidine kinase [Leptolyngbya sp. NIES-3755]